MTKRERWELSVTITKDLKSLKWLASDGDDIEVGKTPSEALDGLYELRKDYIEEEYKATAQDIKELSRKGGR